MRESSGGGVERLAYSPAEVAEAFGLSRKAIYRAIASGELQAARYGGSRLLVPAEEARAWVARNLMQQRPQLRLPVDLRPKRVARRTPMRDALERPAA